MRIGALPKEKPTPAYNCQIMPTTRAKSRDELSVLRRFDKRAETLASPAGGVLIQQEETASLRDLQPDRKIEVCLKREDVGSLNTIWYVGLVGDQLRE